jgi:hypothetical protein
MKKTIIIISIILGIVAMVLGIYFAWKKSRQVLAPPVSNQQPTTNNLQPITYNQQPITSSQPRLKIISDQPVFDYWIATQTTVDKTQTNAEIFYLNQEGKIFKVKENADDEAVSIEPIENLQMIKSSFDGKWALIKSGDVKSPKFTLFNSENKIFELLSQDITAVDFSPDALKIAYLEKSGSNSALSNLVIKDLVGSKPKTTKILSFNQKDFDLSWILADKIVLIPKPSAFYQAAAWSVDIVKKRIDSMNSKNGLILNWSRSGKVGLEFSAQPERRVNRLNLINEQGTPRAVLDFITLPDKCFISEPKVYCAVPNDIPVKTTLPDDYLKKAVYFRDNFYQVDIDQNSMTEIFTETEPAIDATHLNLIDNKLFFINRYDNKLYSIEL